MTSTSAAKSPPNAQGPAPINLAAGLVAEVPDKTGWLDKFATGRSLFGRRNWKNRYFISNIEGVSYYEKEPFVNPNGFVSWDRVTHLYPIINSAICNDANDPDCYYFGLRFIDPDATSSPERLLVARVESAQIRSEWVTQMTQMASEADRIHALLDDDDDGGGDGPTGRADRRASRRRGAVLEALQTRLRTMVSLKKQRFVKDGLDLDLAYVGDRMVAMGFPSIPRWEVQGVQPLLRARVPSITLRRKFRTISIRRPQRSPDRAHPCLRAECKRLP
jgi:hypothetical protein